MLLILHYQNGRLLGAEPKSHASPKPFLRFVTSSGAGEVLEEEEAA